MTAAQELPYGFSPHSAGSAEFDDPFALDDDGMGLQDHEAEDEEEQTPPAQTKSKKTNNRKGPHNADKRDIHNATERARRDSLNTRFMNLAGALPALASIKRPSKAVVVTKALDFVYDSQVRERALVQENNELRLEVDQLRARLGIPALPPPEPLPQPKRATQATLRKTKKQQHATISASASTASIESTSPVAAKVESPEAASLAATSPSGPELSAPASYTHASPSNASIASAPVSPAFFESPSVTGGSPQLAYPPLFSAPPLTASSPVIEAPIASQLPAFFPSSLTPSVPSTQPTASNPYAAMLASSSAALVQAHAASLAGMFGVPQMTPAPCSSSALSGPAGYNSSAAAFMNPQMLYAQMQQQAQSQYHQHHQHQTQPQPQQQYAPSRAEWAGMGGMFSTPLEGLGF